MRGGGQGALVRTGQQGLTSAHQGTRQWSNRQKAGTTQLCNCGPTLTSLPTRVTAPCWSPCSPGACCPLPRCTQQPEGCVEHAPDTGYCSTQTLEAPCCPNTAQALPSPESSGLSAPPGAAVHSSPWLQLQGPPFLPLLSKCPLVSGTSPECLPLHSGLGSKVTSSAEPPRHHTHFICFSVSSICMYSLLCPWNSLSCAAYP